MKITMLAIGILFLMAGCEKPRTAGGASYASSVAGDRTGASAELDGTWESDMMTVTFDFPNHRYSGVALGELFDKQLELVSETGNVVVFTSDTTTIVAQLQSDGSVMLTKQGADGGIPQIFTRSVRQ